MEKQLQNRILERARQMKADREKNGWDPDQSDVYNRIAQKIKNGGFHTNITYRDAEQYFKDVQSYARGTGQLTSGSWSDVMDQQKAADRESQNKSLTDRGYMIRQWAAVERKNRGDEWYNSMMSYLDDMDRSRSEMNQDFAGAKKYYSQWETQESYDEHQRLINSPEYRYPQMDTTQLKQEQGSAAGSDIAFTSSGGKNYTWDALYHIASQKEDVANRTAEYGKDSFDFFQKSKNVYGFDNPGMLSDYDIAYELFQNSMPEDWKWAEREDYTKQQYDDRAAKRKYLEDKYGVTLGQLYDDDKTLSALMARLYEEEPSARARFTYIEQMTPAEQEVLWYIHNTQGRAAAYDWYRQYEDIYQDRHNGMIKAASNMFAEEMPWLASGASAVTNLLAPAEYAIDLVDYALGGEKPYNNMANATSSLRGGVMDHHIDLEVGGYQVGDMLYSTAMSGIDSAVASSVFGKGGGVILGMSAASQATNDAYDRGLTDNKAIWTGVGAGVSEMIFETLSIGKFKSLKEIASPRGKELLKNVAKSMAVNATEEMATEVANIATDFVINDWISDADFSEYSTSVRMYQDQGYTAEDAKRKALGDLGIRVGEAGASGLLMGLGFGATSQAGAIGMSARNYRADTRTAKGLTTSETGMNRLKELAMEVAEENSNKRLKAQIEKTGKNPTVRNTRSLYRSVSDAYYAQAKSDAAGQLKSQGFSKKDADALGSALAAEATGGIIGAEESGVLQKYQMDDRLIKVRRNLLENSKSTVAQRQGKLNELQYESALGRVTSELNKVASRKEMTDTASKRFIELGETQDGIDTLAQAAAKSAAGEKLTAEEKKILRESEYSTQVIQELKAAAKPTAEAGETNTVTADTLATPTEPPSEVQNEAAAEPGVTIQKSTGEAVKIKEVASVKNGKMTLRLEDGSEVDASDVTHGSETEAMVYSAVASLEGMIGPKVATKMSQHLLELAAQGEEVSDVFVRAVAQAYQYGYVGYHKDSINAKGTLASMLTQRQRNISYRYGMMQKSEEGIAKKAAPPKSKKTTAKGDKAPDGKKRYSNVQFEGKIKNWGEKQQAEVAFLDFVARELAGGVTVHVYESFADSNGKRYYRDSSGKVRRAPNGKYDPVTGDIYVDMNAGDHGEGLVLNTFGHELYHHIEKWSPTKARQLAEFLCEEMGINSVEAMVEKQIKKAEDAGHGVEYFMKRGMSRTAAENTVRKRAFSDFVADSMETVFTNDNALDIIKRLHKEDKGLFQRIKDFVSNWVSKLKQFYQENPTISLEGHKTSQLEKFEQIQELFMEALVDAGENFNKGTVPEGEAVDVEQGDRDLEADVQYSDRDYSYNALVNKPDMRVTTVDGSVLYSRADIIAKGKQNAASVGRFDPKTGSVSVHVGDIGKDVIVGTAGLRHGLEGRRTENAIVTLKAGEILQNSIRINEIIPKKENADSSYILIGAASDNNGDFYIVRSVVNIFKNELMSMDVLYAINAKKGNQLRSMRPGFQGPVTGSTISIADLLDHVNQYFPDILPEDVLKHYGYDARPEGILGESALYSDRNPAENSNRSLLVNALESTAQTDWEKKKLQEYKDKIQQIEADEQKMLTAKKQIHKMSFAKGPRDDAYKAKLRELRTEALHAQKRLDILDKQLLRLEATKPLQDVLKREKDKAYKKAVDKYTAARERAVEGRRKTVVKNKIKNFKKQLERELLRPTEKQFIPINLTKAMVDVCGLIDDDSPLYKKDGTVNKAQAQREATRKKLIALADEYNKLKTNADPVYSGEFDEMVYAYLDELRKNYSEKSLDEMSLDELREMYEILQAIKETLQDSRKLIGWGDAEGIYEAGDSIITEQRQIAVDRRNGKRNAGEKARDYTLNLSLSPVRNVERMSGYHQDSYLLKMFKRFEKGVRKKNKFRMDAYKQFEPLTTGKQEKQYFDAIYKEVKGISYVDAEGRKFGVSKMQMMQAILSFEREVANNMGHIPKGGFTFADLKLLSKGKLKEAVSAENAHRVSAAVDIVGDFVEALKNERWCQDYMAQARTFFDGAAKDAVNETSLALKHRIIAKDKNYIPFEVDTDFVNQEISAINHVQETINSYGMLNATKDHAPQPLIITGLNNILDRHIEQVGNLYGLGVEVRNFNKVWNMKSQSHDTTVKNMVKVNWGNGGVEHIEQAVKDIQGPRTHERSWLLDKVESNYIGATFFGNLSMVTKQIGSMFSATSMIKWRDPVRMLGNLAYTMARSKKISAEVDKYTASAWMRRQGMSDEELYTLMTQAKRPGVLRAAEKIPAGINPVKLGTAMDHAVALSLWRYAKIDTKKRTGLKGEDLLKATAEFYDEVIENTQSMTDVLHRPEIQKRKDVVSRSFGMFKTDLFQMAGQLENSFGRFKAEPNKENAAALGKTLYATLSSAIWGQLMTTLWALFRYKVNPFRDEDDEELTMESWLKRQGFALVGDLAGYILPICGSEIVGISERIEYGESEEAVESIGLSVINGVIDTIVTVGTALKDGEMPKADDWKKIATKVLQAFGVPANNIIRTYEAIRLHATDIANGEFLSFEAGVDRSPKHHAHRIIEAADAGNMDVAQGLYDEAVEEIAEEKAEKRAEKEGKEWDGGYSEDDLKSAKSELKTALGTKFKDGEVEEATAMQILSEIFGESDNDIYWILDKWNYAKETGSTDGYSRAQQLYDAMVAGDDATIEELKGHFVNDKGKFSKESYQNAICKGLRENDPRIKKAAEAKANGDTDAYFDIVEEIVAEGYFKWSDVSAAVKDEVKEMKEG